MPELPEVETIRRGLGGFILGKKIRSIKVLCEKSFIGEPVSGKVVGVRRFGKALVLDLEGRKSLMMHLRMTGQLIFDGEERFAAGHPSESFVEKLPNRQTRVILEFENGVLYFNDQRKFGFIKVLETDVVEQEDFIRKLAPEPWQMTGAELYSRLQRHKMALIKAVILDQAVVAGLGNIYADETLFATGIYPGRRAGSVSREEAEKLIIAAREVMRKSIDSGGSTMATYVKADGTRGDYLEKFAQVFRREGQACLRCGTTIVKTKIAGRGTHYCPNCQKNSVTSVRPVEKYVEKPVENSVEKRGTEKAEMRGEKNEKTKGGEKTKRGGEKKADNGGGKNAKRARKNRLPRRLKR